MFGGAACVGILGWNSFGIIGCAIGVPVGLILGGLLGQIPLVVGLNWISRRFDRLTNDELLAQLHDANCCTPNLHLLELNRRGYDIRRELPHVHSLLVSPDMNRRTKGWAALISAFPEMVDIIPGYNPTTSTSECQETCKTLLAATEQSDARGAAGRATL